MQKPEKVGFRLSAAKRVSAAMALAAAVSAALLSGCADDDTTVEEMQARMEAMCADLEEVAGSMVVAQAEWLGALDEIADDESMFKARTQIGTAAQALALGIQPLLRIAEGLGCDVPADAGPPPATEPAPPPTTARL